MTAQDTIPEDIKQAANAVIASAQSRITIDTIEQAMDGHIAIRDVYAAEIAKAILAELQRGQWRPIDENTPHHRNVLVWREDAGEPWVAQYTDETFFDAEAGDSDRMDWFDLAGRYEGVEAPTHWQPLPAGPKGGEA